MLKLRPELLLELIASSAQFLTGGIQDERGRGDAQVPGGATCVCRSAGARGGKGG